jgi:DNA repair protein RadC
MRRPAHLARVRGLGPAKIALLKAVVGLAQRHAEAAITDRPLLSDTSAVRYFLQQRLAGYEREVFACLFLDTRHHLIGFETLFFGSVDRASVHPREVLKQALSCNAAAVVLAHNHPSGNAEPSPSDVRLTEELRSLLVQIDVRVLDHVVVGHGVACPLPSAYLAGTWFRPRSDLIARPIHYGSEMAHGTLPAVGALV